MHDGGARLPHVVIGGAPRSGTMFLCEVLARHPQIHVAHPFIPEPKVCMTPAPRGLAEYRDRYQRLFANAPPGSVLVEKTSAYFENADALARLRDVLPAARFIFILREPVARAYSNWLRTRAQGLETLPFAEAIALEGTRANPLPPNLDYARPFDYLVRGDYGRYAERWIDAVGRPRILFLLFENLISDPETAMCKVQAFIGVHARPWCELASGPVNGAQIGSEGLDFALEARLRRQVTPWVDRLGRICPDLDLSAWRYS
jgi:hypothetical protein